VCIRIKDERNCELWIVTMMCNRLKLLCNNFCDGVIVLLLCSFPSVSYVLYTIFKYYKTFLGKLVWILINIKKWYFICYFIISSLCCPILRKVTSLWKVDSLRENFFSGIFSWDLGLKNKVNKQESKKTWFIAICNCNRLKLINYLQWHALLLSGGLSRNYFQWSFPLS